MIIELKNYKVKIKSELNFGDIEDVQEVIQTTNSQIAGNSKLLELVILEITDLEGREIPYSSDWRRGLSIEDGAKLVSEVAKVIGEVDVKKN